MEKKRILFICSLPRGKHEVRFTDEIGTIEERLLRGSVREAYDFAPKMSVKPLDLMSTIAGSASQPAPYIVHFSLHGSSDQGLIFSDEKQMPAYQSKEYFHDLLETLVDGEGVVGEQPVIPPGGHFVYDSFVTVEATPGRMGGHYVMQDAWGGHVQVPIEPFVLDVPGTRVLN